MAADVEDVEADVAVVESDDVEDVSGQLLARLEGPGEADPGDPRGARWGAGPAGPSRGVEVALYGARWPARARH